VAAVKLELTQITVFPMQQHKGIGTATINLFYRRHKPRSIAGRSSPNRSCWWCRGSLQLKARYSSPSLASAHRRSSRQRSTSQISHHHEAEMNHLQREFLYQNLSVGACVSLSDNVHNSSTGSSRSMMTHLVFAPTSTAEHLKYLTRLWSSSQP
jgi:hypothetical protein